MGVGVPPLKAFMRYNIKIENYSRKHITREAAPDECWDADDIEWEHNIAGFSVVGEKDYWDFAMADDPKGKTLYLVYALCSTGDSFHHEENVICLVGLYEDETDAIAVMNAVEIDNKENGGRFDPITVKLPKKGVEETIATSIWQGYFENLNSVNA